jgi:uncharacterized membrane protein
MTITAEYPVRRASRPVPVASIRPVVPPSRLEGIDLVRGLVIVLMALDHTRDFFSAVRFEPTDLTQTNVALFLTRWITHYCAPTFVLLAGVSAALVGRKRTGADLTRFLLTRGLWLIVLEFTVVNLAWEFNLRYHLAHAQVIWAIGASMVVLAGLVRLSRPVIGAVAVALIAGHNLLDRLTPADFGPLAPLWQVLHVPGVIGGDHIQIRYPLLPWIGVIAAGYLLGRFWTDQSGEPRRHSLIVLGMNLIAAFVVLRLGNVYGDPSPWDPASPHPLLSVLNTTKYPPSLLYLLMTLGPAFLLLALADRGAGRGFRWLVTFGRVPLFFYVAHLYLIHGLAVLAQHAQGYAFADLFRRQLPVGYGFGLPVVYLVWASVIVSLYPLCAWYGRVKAAGRGWWWSYL